MLDIFDLPGLNCKGQENPEFSASIKLGSFPHNPVVGYGTSGTGPEILSYSNFLQKHSESSNIYPPLRYFKPLLISFNMRNSFLSNRFVLKFSFTGSLLSFVPLIVGFQLLFLC